MWFQIHAALSISNVKSYKNYTIDGEHIAKRMLKTGCTLISAKNIHWDLIEINK